VKECLPLAVFRFRFLRGRGIWYMHHASQALSFCFLGNWPGISWPEKAQLRRRGPTALNSQHRPSAKIAHKALSQWPVAARRFARWQPQSQSGSLKVESGTRMSRYCQLLSRSAHRLSFLGPSSGLPGLCQKLWPLALPNKKSASCQQHTSRVRHAAAGTKLLDELLAQLLLRQADF
jgi:hypothetical protein